MIIPSQITHVKYKPYFTEVQKTISSTLDGADNGNVVIKRDQTSGIVTIVSFLPPVNPNLTNIYFFEKLDDGRGEDPFLFLIDVWIEEQQPSLDTMNLQAFLDYAAANPSDFMLQQAVRDQTNNKVLTEYKSKLPVDLALFEAAKKVRIVKWTSDFTCASNIAV